MMKKFFVTISILSLLLFSFSSFAQIPSWNWAWRLGGERVDQINQMETDSSGDVYVMGNIKSSSVVLGGIGYSASNNAARNFLAKFSAQGQLLWHRVYPANLQGASFTIGNNNRLYFFGTFFGTITFGTTTLNSGNAVVRSFVACLDTQANVIWVNDEILDTFGTFFTNYAPHPNGGLIILGLSVNADTLGSFPIPEKSNYLVQMSGAGNILNVVQLGGWGVTNDTLTEFNTTMNFINITVTPKGAVYIGGETRKYPQTNTEVWQLPPLNYENQDDNMQELFVAKFDSSSLVACPPINRTKFSSVCVALWFIIKC